MCYTGVENRTSAPNQYNSIPRIPFRTCVSLKKPHTKSFISAFNKHYPNIGVLPWQCEYATGLEKVYRQQNASVCWTPCRISVACYRANKNKWHISYSQVIFSHFYRTVTVQCVWNICEKVYNLFLSYLWIIKIIVCVFTYSKCPAVCIIVWLDQCLWSPSL